MEHPDFRFEFNPTSTCSVISVEDVSTYSFGIIGPRTDYGFALFWTDGTTTGADFSNPAGGVWTINFPNNGIWTVYLFMLPDQADGFTVDTGDIRFYGGNFYLALQNQFGPFVLPPDAAFWQLLEDTDLAIFISQWNHNISPDIPCGEFHNTWVVNCDEYNQPEEYIETGAVINSACHLYTVLQPYANNTTQNVVVKLFPLDMSEVLFCGIIDVINGETNLDITTEEDNVYVLQIGYSDTDETCEIDFEQEYFEYPIYDFCDALTCYYALVQKLLCNEPDPCCRNCDPEYLAQRVMYREELNKMIALMFQLYGYLNVDQMEYLNFHLIYQYDFTANVYSPVLADRNLVLGRIQDLIKKLKDITGRCGDCNGPRTNSTTTPCTNCGGTN